MTFCFSFLAFITNPYFSRFLRISIVPLWNNVLSQPLRLSRIQEVFVIIIDLYVTININIDP